MLSLARPMATRILQNVFDGLVEEGALYQFTYGLRCPVQKSITRHLGLEDVKIGRALLNLPPATVFRLTRKQSRNGENG